MTVFSELQDGCFSLWTEIFPPSNIKFSCEAERAKHAAVRIERAGPLSCQVDLTMGVSRGGIRDDKDGRVINRLRPVALVTLGALMLLWVTLLNGQPFFFFDTPSYIRGVDAAVVKLLGPGFATPWTTSTVLADRFEYQHSEFANGDNAKAVPSTETRHTMSLQDGVILSGRSIYYASLLYLGELSGGLWLTVTLQAVTIAYLIYVLVSTCVSSAGSTYLISIGFIACFTTAPFYVGFLMPDVFAGATVLATALLLASWNNLSRINRAAIAAILAYSLLCHSTHLLICATILVVYVAVSAVPRFRATGFRLASLFTVASCILVAVLGEVAFRFAVYKTIGFPPITPPFTTARLIELGPGYRYLVSHCGDHSYTVCQFLNRLPLPADLFLWGRDSGHSVFGNAAADTKRALGNEQYKLFRDIWMFEPIGVSVSELKGGLKQFVTFSLSEFAGYGDPDLPTKYQEVLEKTFIPKNIWVVMTLNAMNHIVVTSASILIVSISLLCLTQKTSQGNFRRMQINYLPTWIWATIGVGLVSNALICGALSTAHDRYQARVIWLIPLVGILLLFGISWPNNFSPLRSNLLQKDTVSRA